MPFLPRFGGVKFWIQISISVTNLTFCNSVAQSVEQAQQATVTFKIAFVITDNKNTSVNTHFHYLQQKYKLQHTYTAQVVWENIWRLNKRSDDWIIWSSQGAIIYVHIIASYFFLVTYDDVTYFCAKPPKSQNIRFSLWF